MTKFLIKNISTASLEFLVKDNSEDILMALQPGESGYADSVYTNSMRIFERKNLISVIEEEYTPTVDELEDVNNDETLDNLHTTKSIEVLLTPPSEEDIQKIIETLPEGDAMPEPFSEKKYKGKKRGRKKKRGPKPGGKKNKTNTGSITLSGYTY